MISIQSSRETFDISSRRSHSSNSELMYAGGDAGVIGHAGIVDQKEGHKTVVSGDGRGLTDPTQGMSNPKTFILRHSLRLLKIINDMHIGSITQ